MTPKASFIGLGNMGSHMPFNLFRRFNRKQNSLCAQVLETILV